MKERSYLLFLHDILECIRLLQKYTKDRDFENFTKDRAFQDAVLRRIEIIGEAVKHLPLKIRKEYDKIPWKQVAGIRDIFIHEYYRVNFKLAWEVATVEAPKLRRYILKMMKELKEK